MIKIKLFVRFDLPKIEPPLICCNGRVKNTNKTQTRLLLEITFIFTTLSRSLSKAKYRRPLIINYLGVRRGHAFPSGFHQYTPELRKSMHIISPE